MCLRIALCVAVIFTGLNFSISPAPAQVPGVLIWEYDTSEGVYSAIGVPDVDGDGHPDVVAAIYYINPGADLYCVSGVTGALIWEKSDCLGTWGNKALASIEDLNGDGVHDVILGTPGGSYPGRSVIAKDGATGETIWYNDAPPGWVYSVSAMPDINGDSVPEVIAGCGTSPTTFCLDGVTGDTLWTFEPEYGQACWNVAPIPDVNSSGTADVIVGAEGWATLDRPGIYCVEGANGDTIWSRVVDDNIMDVFSFNDLNGDGIEEVVAGSWTDSVYCFGGADGQLVWAANIGSYVQEVAPIDDVNGDTLTDVLVGSWQSSIYCLDGANGGLLWSTPAGGDCWSVAEVPDVDGDSIADAVVGAVNGRRVLCVSGVDGSPIWDYTSAERVYDVSSVADVNGDGLSDVLVGLQDQGNAIYHLLCFDGDASVGVHEGQEARCRMQDARLLHIHPNPFATRTAIRFPVAGCKLPVAGNGQLETGNAQRVSLSIYDLSGRLVRTLLDNEPMTNDRIPSHVVWDGTTDTRTRVAAGVYLCQVRSGGRIIVGKVMYVR